MSKFNKRHYEAIARVMQSTCTTDGADDDEASVYRWHVIRGTLADMFARDNGLFKRDRFERACEPGANVRART